MVLMFPSAKNIFPTSLLLAIPVNTTLPVITGDALVDSVLSGSNGVWTGNLLHFTYRWLRDGVAISSAISNTYAVQVLDVTHTITFEVTAINSLGTVVAVSLGLVIPNSLLTSIISYWKLNEVSTGVAPVTRVDSVVASANDLTDVNLTPSIAGKISNAANFTASLSQQLNIASNANLQTGDIDFSLCCWVQFKEDTLATRQTVLGKLNSNNDSTNLEYGIFKTQNATQLFFRVSNGTLLGSVFSSANVLGNVWYFVVVMHDSVNNVLTIAVNGIVNTTAYTTGVQASALPFTIGGRTFAALYANALVDEVGFWKRVLTLTEIGILYNNGLGLTYPFTS